MPDRKLLIGMVHVGALPGTPRASLPVSTLAANAAREAKLLQDAGFDSVMIENMHDAPYVHGSQSPEITAAMTRVGQAVREAVPNLQLGVQVLSGGAKEALAIALAIGASFVRVENFVFAHVADEGLLERAEAGPLLRYRKLIGADHIHIYADLKKKHASHAITADVSLAETVEGAMFFGADGVIITGSSTGKPADLADVKAAKATSTKPVLVGSGATAQNAAALLAHADGLIVGSSIKAGGHWSNPVDPARAKEFIRSARP
jgi:uncharacterized protein